ncbi:MAG: guanylate kinase [Deltaproteobacteria bacterium]|nr:guanylate kinase [Deltaproteobacteria bacterium]
MLILVLSAPSGAGKSTVCRRLLARRPDLALSVSHTTRLPRQGEVDGRDYHFVDAATFAALEAAGGFLEQATVHGSRYGTAHEELRRHRAAGRNLLLDVDVQGGRALRAALPGAVTVFLLPPGMAALEERLRGRGTDGEEVIRRRLANARAELAAATEYEHLVVNDDVERAVDRIVDIMDRSDAARKESP